ncbi:MAG: phosphohydrolase, partial [Desulfovibrionaceae bacterium]
YVTRRAVERGVDAHWRTARASALLHDLAKTYTIRYGGNHSQLGAAWAMELTGNPLLCMGIVHHVYWPFDLDAAAQLVPLSVIYGDKRVTHDHIVGLDQRFDDLIERYGATETIRARILVTHEQAVDIENQLSELIQEDLHACAFDCGRLVHGA